MQQPELGKKMAELRKAKGLTQDELAKMCNISARTVQRIETGDVVPRSYTAKVIFNTLGYDIYGSNGNNYHGIMKIVFIMQIWSGQVYKYFIELFNLKTKTMRKITVLTILLVLIGLGLSSVFSESRAQKVNELTVQFKEDNADFMRWFNNGQVDSLLTIYRNDACVLPENVCGKDNIRELFNLMINEGNYKFLELTTQSISVCDTIAVEKGKWTVKLNSGPVIKGMFMSEWRYSNKKWQIVYDISSD